MLVLIAITLLLLTPVAMLIIRLVRPGFAYFWLIAAGCALVAWALILVSGFSLPQTIPLVSWKPEALFFDSPELLVDRYSWPFALAIATLAAAVVLTAVVRMSPESWRAWGNSLAVGGLGLLAVLAGNPLTLLLAWAALDLVELLILLSQVLESKARERAVIAFSARTAGIVLLVWGSVLGPGGSLSFEMFPQQVNLYFLLAAGLRLGVLPMHLPFTDELLLRRGLATMLRLTGAAGSLMLLTRVAVIGIPEPYVPFFVAVAGFSAIYSAISWANASNELSGRPFWILALSSLTVASAVQGQPEASLVWGTASIFSGGILFLMSVRHNNLLAITFLGVLGILALPYTPAWEGMLVYSPPYRVWQAAFFAVHAFLVLGYARHALRANDMNTGGERWVWFIYPVGLALLPVGQLVARMQAPMEIESMPAVVWIGGLVAIVFAFLLYIVSRRYIALQERARPILRAVFSLDWLYRLFWAFYRSTGRLVGWVTVILEGEGGVLWALVLLAILFSLFTLSGTGG